MPRVLVKTLVPWYIVIMLIPVVFVGVACYSNWTYRREQARLRIVDVELCAMHERRWFPWRGAPANDSEPSAASKPHGRRPSARTGIPSSTRSKARRAAGELRPSRTSPPASDAEIEADRTLFRAPGPPPTHTPRKLRGILKVSRVAAIPEDSSDEQDAEDDDDDDDEGGAGGRSQTKGKQRSADRAGCAQGKHLGCQADWI